LIFPADSYRYSQEQTRGTSVAARRKNFPGVNQLPAKFKQQACIRRLNPRNACARAWFQNEHFVARSNDNRLSPRHAQRDFARMKKAQNPDLDFLTK
jgi:hypothetical protein